MTEPTGQPDEQTTVGQSTPPTMPVPAQGPVPAQQYPSQGYPAQPVYVPQQPFPAPTYPAEPYPGPTYPAVAYPATYPAEPYPAPQAPPKRKKRTFMIISFVIVGLLVLCGGVATTAILVTNRQSGTGQDSPVTAVNDFLTAIYVDKDATKAAQYVCADSQKSGTLTGKVKELKLADTKYRSPHYDWTAPAVDKQTKSAATVSVTIIMVTLDERTATEKLTFTTVQSHGWWVCEVTTGK